MNKEKNIIAEVAGVLTSNFAALFFGLCTGIILSRFLGPELKGVYTSILVIPGIISSFIMFGSRPSVIYHIGKKIFTNEQVISAVFFLYLTSCIAGILIFISSCIFFLDRTDYTPLMVILVTAYIPVKLLITYSVSIFLANLKFKKANRLKWLTALLTLITVFVFVFIFKMSVSGALVALLSSTIVVMLIGIIQIARDFGIRIHFNRETISKIFSIGIIYALAMFIIQLNFRVDILILNHLSTKAEIGFYSVGVSVAEKLWQLPFAVSAVVISRSAATKDISELTRDVSRLLRLAFLIILVACIILYFIVPYVIPFLYGEKFSRSAAVVQNILPGIIFFVIVRVLSSSLAGLGKPWVIIAIFLPALIFNIILNYIWIPDHGCIGAAWATNASYISGSLVILFVYSRITKTPLSEFILFRKDDFHIIRNLREVRKERKKLKSTSESNNFYEE